MSEWIRTKRSVRAALLLGAAAVFAAGALYLYFHDPYQYPLPCIIKPLTGLYCPGCGAGRACFSILHGKFFDAFCYNPLLVILLPFAGGYIAARGIDWAVTGGNHRRKDQYKASSGGSDHHIGIWNSAEYPDISVQPAGSRRNKTDSLNIILTK